MGKEDIPPVPDRIAEVAATGLSIVASTAVVLTLVTAPFLRRFSGAPYVASSRTARHTIRRFVREEVLRRKAMEARVPRLLDLGAGSGEIVLDAAAEGCLARGAELNIWLVIAANWRAWRRGLHQLGYVEWCDMWSTEANGYDVVTVFGVPCIMDRIGKKMLAEAKDECTVCSNSFAIPGWTGQNIGNVWFYKVRDQRFPDT